ncbi:MAG: transglutaminase domain-containing protein [Oscillospiraceae bacterium]|nr:transglutaminase domain-containing protein [Oscillospiraceae bacterium]
MKDKKLAVYGEYLLLWALCTVCITATIHIYLSSVINFCSVLGAVMSAAVILFIEFTRKKKYGSVLYVAAMVLVSFVPSFAITSLTDMIEFVQWFFSGSEAVETKTSYILMLTVLMGFFFTSVACYFTRVIYRSSIITLISLIPFALAVKTVTSLPYAYPAIVSALNIMIFVFNSRKTLTADAKTRGKSTLTVYTDFTLAVIMLALLIPKPEVAPYYEKFEEFTNRFQIGGSSEARYTGEYKDISGGTDDLRRGESVLIYLANTKNPVYMKTQVFDIYDAEQGGWVEIDEMTGSKKWQEKAPLLNYAKLGETVNVVFEDTPSVADFYPAADRLTEIEETESYAVIYTQNYPAAYILSPLRATGLSLPSVTASYSARSDDGEIFTNIRHLPENASYTVRYYSEDVFEELITEGLCDVSAEDYGTFLSFMYVKFSENSDVIREFYRTHQIAMEYRENTQMDIPVQIQRLANQITDGLEYDYQKAEAIEEYFLRNGFVYDLAYEPPEETDTPEYFLFESKRGICSDFATAYTLLARASGLTVRYVEGFVMQGSKTTDDLYYIYTDNAHAYPEVYIPGAGWVVYEPTPAEIVAAGEGQNNENERTDPLAIVFTAIIAVAVIGLLVLLMILFPKLMERLFRLRVRLSDSDKAVVLLYNRHAANMERRFGQSCKALTPEQLAEYTNQKTSISLEPLTKPFIKACYGGAKPEKDEKKNAYVCYRMQHKAIKKCKKRKD